MTAVMTARFITIDTNMMALLITFSIVGGITLVMAQRMNFGHRSSYHKNLGCPRGRFGPSCDRQCTEDWHCKRTCQHCDSARCTADGRCMRTCLPGWWKHCEERCSSGCVGEACDDKDGICLHGCKPGVHGPSCSEHCSKYCSGRTCWRNGSCECKAGYSGPTCTEVCPSQCASCVICTSCEEGYYGIQCEIQCEEGCHNTSCGKDGSCLCQNGFYGRTCSQKCTMNCKTPGYDNPTGPICDEAGTCLLGCRAGWFGMRCDKRCSKACSNMLCHQGHGECLTCILGRYGPSCNLSCGQCLDRSCNGHDGSCLSGCKNGFFGKTCNKVCSLKCLHRTCTETPSNGSKCFTGCVGGWWGSDCERACPGQCITCEWSTGACTSCDGHHTGHTCKDLCSPGCIKGMCSMKGDCTTGCRDGFYSRNCSLRCGTGCEACRREDGSCWYQLKGKESFGVKKAVLVILFLVILVLVLLPVSSFVLMSSFSWKSKTRKRTPTRQETFWRFLSSNPVETTETLHVEDDHIYEDIDLRHTSSL